MDKEDDIIIEQERVEAIKYIPSVLEKVLDWSETLPDWQSDALRKLLQQNDLSDQDINEILDMLKTEHDLIDKHSLTIKPKRLTKKDIPIQTSANIKISLNAMHDLRNVNAVAVGQTLKFNQEGITIVYGNNASGKSGYARVLKKACRARGEKRPILPNVFLDILSASPAQAIFDVYNGKEIVPLAWIDDQEPPELLANTTVFDSHCARVYIDEANAVAYIPYGLDIFDKIARLCEKLKNKLLAEIQAIDVNKDVFSDLREGTVASKFVDEISHETRTQSIEDLVKLSEDEEKRLTSIGEKLAQIRIKDPKDKAESLRIKKRRVERLLGCIEKLDAALSIAAIEKVEKLQQELGSAKKAAQIASQRSFKDEPLPGATSEAWKIMFEAAKQYSEQLAYPEKPFPVTKKGARCVLCFQVLSENAARRLEKFQEFIQDKTEQVVSTKRQAFEEEVSKIVSLQVNPFSVDPDIIEEIKALNTEVAMLVKEYLESVHVRYEAIQEARKNNMWNELPALVKVPSEKLNEIIANLEKQAKEFDGIAVPGEKINLEKEFDELNARKQLASKKDKVIQFVKNLQKIEKLNLCSRATNTTSISRKATELMASLITDKLKCNLKKEFKVLDVEYIKIALDKMGRAGVTLHQFKLQSKTYAAASLSDVLSEGEQRAIALASFFAELETSPSRCPIIFDDPVTSLDHMRRERIAQRLVAESKKRQVIAFTHDLVFLVAIQHEAKKQGAHLLIQTLWGGPKGTGFCDSNAPWHGQTVKTRIGYLKQSLEKVRKAYNNGNKEEYERRMEDCYRKLRDTCERAIEEVVFNDTIQRFRYSIETNRLKKVHFGDNDYKFIEKAMTKYSECVHDQSPARNIRIPTLDELHVDIEELEKFVDEVRKRTI